MMSLSLPRTGVAITVDLGDGDLHPKTKDKIGARAALAARMIAYDEKIVGMGPTFKSATFAQGIARITFDNTGSGPASKDNEPLRFFAIAGVDRKFHWAQAKLQGNEVIVSSEKVAAPVAVRYGWIQTGATNLVNKEGLPASPFRTDVWNDEADKAPRLKGPVGKGIAWNGQASRWPNAPFAIAAQQGDIAAMKTLLAQTPDVVKQFNATGINLLNAPIVENRIDAAKLLLDQGADVNLPELSGLYPIHRAALHGRLEIVMLLLEKGANVMTPTRNPGQAMPLFFAAQFDQADVVAPLLDKGANLEIGRRFYRAGSGIESHSPLWAAFEKTKTGKTAMLLIERGAKIDQPLPGEMYAIHLAARKNLPRVIELLRQKGTNVNQDNGKGRTPLESAASEGAAEAVAYLLKYGATVSPAAIAAAKRRSNNKSVVTMLEEAGSGSK
jgi:ankyrin repeat protein